MGKTFLSGQRVQLLLVLCLFASLIIFALSQGPPDTAIPYDLSSAAPNGLRALRLWLQELGYDVGHTTQRRFVLPPTTDLLFVFPNQRPYEVVDAAIVRTWVQQGGTLVIVGNGGDDIALTDEFGISTAPVQSFGSVTQQAQPLLPDIAASWPTIIGKQKLELSQAPRAVPILVRNNGEVTAAVQQLGKGTVWRFTADHDFTNQVLLDRQQAALVPALLRTVPDGGSVLFDAFHLFDAAQPEGNQIASIQDWFYRTSIGRALLFGIGVILVYLLLEGRRLGPPLPVVTGMRRREAAEYVTAIAGLQQRSHLGGAVARHHKRRMKAELGRGYRIGPDLPDPEFVLRLAKSDGYIVSEQVRDVEGLLQALDVSTDDKSLIQLVGKVDQLLKRIP